MSRDSQYDNLVFSTAAASAGTTYAYVSVHAPFVMEGFEWWYGAADGIAQATGLTVEANTDNTIKLAVAYATDGSTFTGVRVLVPNFTNAAGLLDSAAPGVPLRNPSNPGSGGAAFGAETALTAVRVPSNAIIRVQFITAGTSTIPPQSVRVYGKFLATDGVT